ncbi:MAG: zinc-binding alcohol dehydrogenase [Burkholderiales bacterium]|nr:MAG: zinc-binding alcohol dehydrogenase [Burkholderiales bacterium]
MTEAVRARAFWTVAAGRGELRDEPLAEPGPGEVRVRALRSGISRGTESLVFLGRVPDGQRAAMRCPFQAGDFPGPVKYGYASVGVVEAGAADLLGRRVFCLHPHQDRYVVPTAAVVPLPEAVSDARGVLAANMETAVNGLWDAAPRAGDRISVVGAGVVGSLVAALAARMPGARVELIDPDPRRAPLAARLGCAFASPADATPDADLVVHASGHPAGLATALGLAGFEATVLELSWYGDRAVSLPLGEAFHSKRLQLRSSQVGAVATAQRARWTHLRRMTLALELLEDPVFDALLTGESPFASLPATLARLAASPDGALCHVVSYP